MRLPERLRSDMDAMKRLPIPLPPRGESEFHQASLGTSSRGQDKSLNYIPLSAVADFDLSPGPNQVSRENGKRRVVATALVNSSSSNRLLRHGMFK